MIPGSIVEAIGRKLNLGGLPAFQSGCKGKIPYQTWEEAKRGARTMHKQMHRQFDVYRCRFCDTFHIGGRRNDLRLREVR